MSQTLRIAAVLNAHSGTLRTLDRVTLERRLGSRFAAQGHTITITWASGRQLVPALQRSAADEAVDVVLAAGGDGTISAAAGIVREAGKVLAVLPGGTMNLFARALRMPLDPLEAIDVLAVGEVVAVDVATANGRPFLHQFALGLHPRIIRLRNSLEYGSRFGKMLASVRAAAAIVRDPPTFVAGLAIDEEPLETARLSAISISAVPFGEGHLPYGDVLDAGRLGIYTTNRLGPFSALKLAKDVMLGSWSGNDHVTVRHGKRVEVVLTGIGKGARATIDGEVVKFVSPVRIENHPGALRVLRPAALPPTGVDA